MQESDLAMEIRRFFLKSSGYPDEIVEYYCDKSIYPADLFDEVTNLYIHFMYKDMEY